MAQAVDRCLGPILVTTLPKTTQRRSFFLKLTQTYDAVSYYDGRNGRRHANHPMTLQPETLGTWRAGVDVRAEPEQVLATLTDVEACEAWSPVGFEVEGLRSRRLQVGTKVAVSGAIVGRRVRFCVEIIRADSE